MKAENVKKRRKKIEDLIKIGRTLDFYNNIK